MLQFLTDSYASVEKLVDENKTMYLAQRGIRWKSPTVMNPRVMFV